MDEENSKNIIIRSQCKYDHIFSSENVKDDNEHDWWASDSASSTGSYYSDTDSSTAEWESEINSNGELIYIESAIDNVNDEQFSFTVTKLDSQPELMRRRSTRAGKLMRFIKRKESKRLSTRNKKSNFNVTVNNIGNSGKDGTTKEVTFRDFQAGETREVILWVDPDRRHKLGRRATLCEAYFGIIPSVFSDKTRIMVAGFIPDGEAIKNKNIKIGDWLRSINSNNVTYQNLDNILSEITVSTNVTLELQRIAGIDVTATLSGLNCPKQSVLVQRLMNKEESKDLMQSIINYPLGVLYLQTTELSEVGPELQGVLYTFPRSENKNMHSILCTARGAFITLNHLLPEIGGLQPTSTTIQVAEEEIHVIYTPRNDELLLLAFPKKCCSLEEAINLSNDIVKTLEFGYQSLTKCFTSEENQSSLDHFFILIIQRLLDIKSYAKNLELTNSCIEIHNNIENIESYKFRSAFSVANFIELSRDAQIQIDAALSEMEAMDYRDWNEDPMDCQRLYTILGSCIYHKHYLLGSHLIHNDLIEIESYLRQNCILNLINNEPVKSLVIWKRVYPSSYNHKNIENNKNNQSFIPNGKWYLLIVGYGHDLLAVLLESGGCTAKCNEIIGPDIFYVEEAQETLKHIQKIGVTTLAAKWIASNTRPEVITYEDVPIKSSSITENLLGLIKSTDVQSVSIKPSHATNSNKRPQEIPSILKKRNIEEFPVVLGSVYSLHTSEDSLSQGTGGISEISDEAMPILGRRATREKIVSKSRYSDDSDSDIDVYKNNCQMLNLDISNIRENLLSQAEYLVPKVLTMGDKNYLYHYVHLDMVEGILLSSKPLEHLGKNPNFLINFNKCVHIIHRLLHNTVRFKAMLNSDADKTVINKSLIAVKEHGVLFEWENLTYWVVGRLFTTPHPKELYVCYQDSAPQNLIEIAFKLHSLHTLI
ncbi:protein inturned [Apis mellifera caucasica]|uniref:Protein inturned n=2 Tax=Apis TaxID=7459 RepID=A0A7M7GFF5_APIME|nr:protein inturned [Apis mellifera]KAG6797320.1 protein inturned [Apis mellifera caucasica]KAG9437735.1 protein inturned [Apis mellifera carnica]|eukprot:XP_003251640.1 protein inturned [Apis mellifera]